MTLDSFAIVKARPCKDQVKLPKDMTADCLFEIVLANAGRQPQVFAASSATSAAEWVRRVNDIKKDIPSAALARPSATNHYGHLAPCVLVPADLDPAMAAFVDTPQISEDVWRAMPVSNVFNTVGFEHEPRLSLLYTRFFAWREHVIQCAMDEVLGPIFFALVREQLDFYGVPTPYLRVLVKNPSFQHHELIKVKPFRSVKKDVASVIEHVRGGEFERLRKQLKPANHARVVAELCEREAAVCPDAFSFGVVRVLPGQTGEDVICSNDAGPASGPFAKLLGLLGERVSLAGWTRHAGALDTRADSTMQGIYTQVCESEVMFDVAPLLGETAKRFVLADTTVIVFIEDPTMRWDPAMLGSKNVHVQAVLQVRPDGRLNVALVARSFMPRFGPLLHTSVYELDSGLVDLLLMQLINGERTALAGSPVLQQRSRTATNVTLRGLYFDVACKLECSASIKPPGAEGRPPLDGASLTRVPVVDPSVEIESVNGLVRDCVFWRDHFVYGSEQGVFIRPADVPSGSPAPARQLSSTPVASLVVVQQADLVVFLDAGGSGVYVLHLSSIDGGSQHLVKGTRGANMMEVNTLYGTAITLCVGVKHDLIMFNWVQVAFVRVRKIPCMHVVRQVKFQGSGVVVGNSYEYFTIGQDDARLDMLVADKKDKAVDIVILSDSLTLLCHGTRALLYRTSGARASSFDIVFSAVPRNVGVCPPYVFGVLEDRVEVRSLMNGGLVQEIILPAPLSLLYSKGSLLIASHTSKSTTQLWTLGAASRPTLSRQASAGALASVLSSVQTLETTDSGESDGAGSGATAAATTVAGPATGPRVAEQPRQPLVVDDVSDASSGAEEPDGASNAHDAAKGAAASSAAGAAAGPPDASDDDANYKDGPSSGASSSSSSSSVTDE